MTYLLFIIGAALIYFGALKKVSAKKVSDMTGGDLVKTGLNGYLKVMMIVGGIAFIFIGFIWKVFLG